MGDNLISRRGFLIASAAVVVTACSGSEKAADAPVTATAAAEAEPSTAPPAPATTAAAPPTEPPATEPPPTDPPVTEPGVPEYAGDVDPFMLGVASGDPDAESVVHWTRLVPDGVELPDEVTVMLEVFGDEALTAVVSAQALVTSADVGYSVHALTTGLDPDTWYWYRFSTGEFASAVGRSRTTPAAGSTTTLNLATASCQHYETGFYTAHADIAASGVDLVAWLGDYIYEGATGSVGDEGRVRIHGTAEPTTLDEYRARYAVYKSDPNLQAAHAACPWVVIWDDHEVENNYAGNISQDDIELGERRAAAYRAWWENTPTRVEMPTTADAVIYRGFEWGSLVDISFLDTRQYRTDQACGDITLSTDPPCPETFDTDRTMLGTEQREWLLGRLGKAGATWNVLGQQVIMGNFMLNGAVLNFDQWDGYPVERDALFQHIADEGIANFVVLTGDIHFAGVGNLRTPDRSKVIGTEFVATSISSAGNVSADLTDLVKSLGDVVDAELAHRGWIRHTVTADSWVADYRIVDDVLVENSPMSTYRSFTVTAGTPGITV